MAAAYERFCDIEPTWFELTRTPIVMPGVQPRRLLHISDIHISDGMTAGELAMGVEAGLAARPDLICLTGDFVTTTVAFDKTGLRRLLRRMAATAPTYAVLGNHDGRARSAEMMRDLIGSAGIRVLHNESAAHHELTIVGVADFWSGEFDPARAFEDCCTARPTLVLCHNPDGKRTLRDYPWQLMLSGHTHGGQVCIPGVNPFWTPVWDKRFVAGLYHWENRQIFITRGIGSPKHVRAFCRPEVSLLEFRARTAPL
jgi:uncharacterized protein